MKNMLFAALLSAPVLVSAQELPQPSPSGRVSQVVGLTNVTINYSRPSVKGREIFGALVPYGKVWRAGANKCTTFETSGPILVEGQELAQGIYSLFAIPDEGAWVIIFNKDTTLWGEGDRKDEADALRVKVRASKLERMVETFTITLDGVVDDNARMELQWANVGVSVSLYANAVPMAMANIKAALAKGKMTFGDYNNCARFCLDRKVELANTLTWSEKSVSMERKFWNLHTYARALAANGRMADAVAAAQESFKLAEEAKNDAYMQMNKEKMAE
ncbi:MAG TPA: DUF2911 domain-containing protein, partial [Flavobacteriales bacterium]|nr:DUF2911 domain-containing protein [Flavobacteriales bacterium]